ncbi:MAG: integrase catalytic subunit [Rhodocyclaceae bacterium]|nr:MAG: integrase catalytic subunit [Rhodocyclaceae bacterium]
MDQELRKNISLFRFTIISPLVHRKGMSRGEQEALLRDIMARAWEIPGSPRSSIARSTVLRWVALYERGGRRIEALEPQPRKDRGTSRALGVELEAALVTLRKEHPAVSLPVFVKLARSRKILDAADKGPSKDSLYRLFKRHGFEKDTRLPEDRRRFETELPNDMWQSDCMHGPQVIYEGKIRKAYLFAILDDHSRLVPQAQFYRSENLDCFRDCLISALEKRGLPRRLYVDNGAAFRSNTLAYACGRLGIALLHSRPYIPEGRGKIERFFLTVRKQFLPTLPEGLSLERLNELLAEWIDGEYHRRIHSSTGQTPIARYLAKVALLRPAPKDLRDYFRVAVQRRVAKDRTITLLGRNFEAPVGLIGQTVTLLYHERDPERVEIVRDEVSQGFLVRLDQVVNSRIKREGNRSADLVPPSSQAAPPPPPPPRSGSLFGSQPEQGGAA